MAISFIQSDDFTDNNIDTTIATDGALNTTTGNLLVVTCGNWTGSNDNGVISSISDTAGNTYTKAIGEYISGGTAGERCEIWYAENITGNASNITTITFTGSTGFRYISVSEFSGAVTSNVLDDTSSNTNTTATSHTSNNATSSSSGALIVGAYNGVDAENITAGSSFTDISSDTTSVFSYAEYQVLGAASDYDADLTTGTTTNSIMLAAIFKQVSAIQIIDESDTTTLSENLVNQSKLSRIFTDTTTLSDSLSLDEIRISRLINETDNFTISDSLVIIKIGKNLISESDTTTLSDSLTSQSKLNRTFSDTTTLSDSLVISSDHDNVLGLVLSDTTNLSDSLTINKILDETQIEKYLFILDDSVRELKFD